MRIARYGWLAAASLLSCAPATRVTSRHAPPRAAPTQTAPPPSARPLASPAPRAAASGSAATHARPVAPPPGCTLPVTLADPPVYLATLFRGGRLERTDWDVEKDGTIRSVPRDAQPGTAGRVVVLKSAAQPAVSSGARGPGLRSVPGAIYRLSGSPRRCSLELPGEKKRIVRMQWYNFDSLGERFALLSPMRPAGWVLVLHEILFSPGLDWFAPALGDIDGDGRDDLAFVAQGVGTCGGVPSPDCPLLWVEVIMTATDTASRLTLVQGRTFDRLMHELGLPRNDVGEAQLAEPSRWHGRILRGRFRVSVSGPRGRHTWTAVLRKGTWTLQNPLAAK